VNATVLLLVPVLVLAVVAVGAFAGCGLDAVATGEAPVLLPPRGPESSQPPPPAPIYLTPFYEDVVVKTSGLRHYWRLGDAATSGVAADSVLVMPVPGKYLGGVTRGKPGALRPKQPADTAAEFDGASGYVEVPYNAMVNPLPTAFSVEAWIRPDTVAPPAGTTVIRTIVGSYEVAPPRGFVLELVLSTSAAKQFTAKVRVRLGDGTQFRALDVDLGAGKGHDSWRHVVTTYESTMTKATLKLYVRDGVENFAAELPAAPRAGYQPVAPTLAPPLRIGAGRTEPQPAGGGAPAAGFFKGMIDEVALYAVALPATIVKAHTDNVVITP
jgi:hypothetical protein